MNIFRSEDIHLIWMAVTKNAAFNVAFELSKLNTLQIIDLNKRETIYKLLYSKEIRSCNETERKIDMIQKTCEDFGVPILHPDDKSFYFSGWEALR